MSELQVADGRAHGRRKRTGSAPLEPTGKGYTQVPGPARRAQDVGRMFDPPRRARPRALRRCAQSPDRALWRAGPLGVLAYRGGKTRTSRTTARTGRFPGDLGAALDDALGRGFDGGRIRGIHLPGPRDRRLTWVAGAANDTDRWIGSWRPGGLTRPDGPPKAPKALDETGPDRTDNRS